MEQIADGVHLVRRGLPAVMNVYLIEDENGVTVFDAGAVSMVRSVSKAAAGFGGVKRVVLGHSHTDHRGCAPKLAQQGAKVYCHEAELKDAETDGGMHYFDLKKLPHLYNRIAMAFLLKFWDGGPVPIEGTVSEGDSVAGFEVIHLPGHAPGLIALYRESDGLMLSSDAIYTIDPTTGKDGAPRIPLDAFNLDTGMAMASALKIASIGPAKIWAGHGQPLDEDVTAVLDHLGRHGGVYGE